MKFVQWFMDSPPSEERKPELRTLASLDIQAMREEIEQFPENPAVLHRNLVRLLTLLEKGADGHWP